MAPELLARYGLVGRSLSVTGYTVAAAVAQKVLALAKRKESQTRDVFDLHHLLHLAGGAHATSAALLVGQQVTPELISRIL